MTARYEREILVGGRGEACAVLDGQVFAHAAPSLKDLRLYAGGAEVPYAITLSEAAQAEGDVAEVLHVRRTSAGLAFDLHMPGRPYTEVILDLHGKDFQAHATVRGMAGPDGPIGGVLGTAMLFDLTAQKLSRNTGISFQESRFPFLHVVLEGPGLGPEMVRGAAVPPSREAQTLFSVVATSRAIERRGNRSMAVFQVPARVPVERVTVGLAPGFEGNFSSAVTVTARAEGQGSASEVVEGTVMRVRMGAIQMERISFPASLGANLQEDATVEVAIDADHGPLPVASVALAMRERKICFDAPGGSPMVLFYGDPGLAAPDFGGFRLKGAAERAIPARLGVETVHPGFHPAAEKMSFAERHRELPWVILVIVVALAGQVAMRRFRGLFP